MLKNFRKLKLVLVVTEPKSRDLDGEGLTPDIFRQIEVGKAAESLAKDQRIFHYYLRKQSSTVRARGEDERELLSLAARIPYDDRLNQHLFTPGIKLSHHLAKCPLKIGRCRNDDRINPFIAGDDRGSTATR